MEREGGGVAGNDGRAALAGRLHFPTLALFTPRRWPPRMARADDGDPPCRPPVQAKSAPRAGTPPTILSLRSPPPRRTLPTGGAHRVWWLTRACGRHWRTHSTMAGGRGPKRPIGRWALGVRPPLPSQAARPPPQRGGGESHRPPAGGGEAQQTAGTRARETTPTAPAKRTPAPHLGNDTRSA